jgi:hypothetical protein
MMFCFLQKGQLWGNSSAEEPWVKSHNDIFTQVAKAYNDSILDWHTLSHQYLDSLVHSTSGLHAHSDAIHYCAGGFPRLASLLLQDMLLAKE